MERRAKIAFSARQNSENGHMRYKDRNDVSLNFWVFEQAFLY